MFKPEDSFKIMEICKTLLDPANKLSKFMIGNLETLRDKFTDAQMVENCKKFHNANYFPSLMSLCLYSSRNYLFIYIELKRQVDKIVRI